MHSQHGGAQVRDLWKFVSFWQNTIIPTIRIFGNNMGWWVFGQRLWEDFLVRNIQFGSVALDSGNETSVILMD